MTVPPAMSAARRTHHLYRDGAQARLAQLPGRIGRERSEFFAAVHSLAQERELLLQGLDLLFASHIRSPPFYARLKARRARR